MNLFTRVVRSPLLLRRLIVELRGIRRAAERVADCLELQAGSTPRSGQTFRGFSREKDLGEGEGSDVSYVSNEWQTRAAEKEDELVSLLGRTPTPEELERAMAGDIE